MAIHFRFMLSVLFPTFKKLYLLAFSSASTNFEFRCSFSVQPPFFSTAVASSQFPSALQDCGNLLPRFPSLTLFKNLFSTSNDTELYIPFSLPSYLLRYHLFHCFSTSLLYSPPPLITSCGLRLLPLTSLAVFPFLRRVQFWIASIINIRKR